MDFYETPIIGGIKCEHSLAFNIIKLYDFILHHSAEPFFLELGPAKENPICGKDQQQSCAVHSRIRTE